MKRIVKGGCLTVCALMFSFSCMAVKAKPGIIDFIDGEGKTVQILLHGDESFHFVTDTQDNVMFLNERNVFEHLLLNDKQIKGAEYIRTIESDRLLKEKVVSGRNLSAPTSKKAKYTYSTSAFPTIGEPHSLVILVEYPDHGFNVENPKEYFEDFLNGENFTRDNGTGSVGKFYVENSKGAFKPTYDVYGPVKLKNKRRFYGGGDEDNAKYMVVEAVEALDETVDFSIYDHNDDGYVDSVYIIYSDKGEADSGIDETVWPYSWELEDEDIFLSADGVKFNTYGCSNEIQSDGDIEGIGTFTHEFGHVLGLPDLYNTEKYNDYSTPMEWSLMDSGSYNNDSRTPCNLSSFERYSLGWLTPEELVASGNYSIGNLAETNKAFIMTSEEKEDEFFILEYRMNTGWDTYLPSHGMLIWHIDFDQRMWDWNTVNNISNHQYVRLVRADNSADLRSLEGDSFPGTSTVTAFGKNTIPALKSWRNTDLNVTLLSNITENINDERCSFDVEVNEFRGSAGIENPALGPQFFISGQYIMVSEGEYTVYDLSGRTVGVVSKGNPLRLNKGIYISAGKKIMVK